MPSFAFSLQGVLEHRSRLEQEAQRSLAIHQRRATALHEQIQRLNQVQKTSNQQFRKHLVGRIHHGELRVHGQFALDAEQRRGALAEGLMAARAAIQEARQVLVAASRERRVLEVLKEKQRERWLLELRRRELAEADDVTRALESTLESVQ